MKKKLCLFLVFFVLVFSRGNAQGVKLYPYYPYSNWTFGVSGGFSELYGNLSHPNSEPVFKAHLEKNSNMWVNLDFEFQKGGLSDYEVKNAWTSGLNVYNTFTAFSVNGKVAIGELFRRPKNFLTKTLFGLYGGIGIGYMSNNVSNITMKFKFQDKYSIIQYNPNNIKTTSSNYFIPLNLGINIHMTKRCMFNANYQFNYAFSDYLDGYNFTAPTAINKYNDFYSVMSFGLNFYIGKISYHYRKYGEQQSR